MIKGIVLLVIAAVITITVLLLAYPVAEHITGK
jgi:hypothetical protein